MNFKDRPVLLFWETTRACGLSCVHCRASALLDPLPGELTTEEGFRLIDTLMEFGKPYPTIIFTGGDPLRRRDIFQLLEHTVKCGIRAGVSPAVTELLNDESISALKALGVASMSVSLDGARRETHDSIRRREGTFDRTIDVIKKAIDYGLNIQVNTAIMRQNLYELPGVLHLIKELGVRTWELFFLIRVGRGSSAQDLTPYEYESVCNWVYDASHYGLTIRTVEAPFVRRVAKMRSDFGTYWNDVLYHSLSSELQTMEGPPGSNSTLAPRGTLDGDGIIFVAYDGSVYPGGLVPCKIGDVRGESIVQIYRENELLTNVRARRIRGRCGSCEFREICGGSRARAYSYASDPLASDPACFLANSE